MRLGTAARPTAPATPETGGKTAPIPNWGWSISPLSSPPKTIMAVFAPATACSLPIALSPSTSRPAKRRWYSPDGASRHLGSRQHVRAHSLRHRCGRKRRSRRWRRFPNRLSPMCWTAPTASRSGRFRKCRCRGATRRANGIRRPSSIPSKPPAFDVQGVAESDLIDFTPELRAEALRVVANYRIGPLYTPPCESKYPGPLATILNPGNDGGVRNSRAARSIPTPTFSTSSPTCRTSRMGWCGGNPARTDMEMVPGTATASWRSGGRGLAGQRTAGVLLRLRAASRRQPAALLLGAAVDVAGGRQPRRHHSGHGPTADQAALWAPHHCHRPQQGRDRLADRPWRNAGRDQEQPGAEGTVAIPRTGSMGKVGLVVTKTLVIAGDGTATTGADGRNGGWLRAYDKKTTAGRSARFACPRASPARP